ncbi:MAG: Na(+)-translocating NADH-quinone reductase subunit C [Rubripirellula sp.]
MQQRDSLGYTLLVAAVLCVVCSLAVSTAAVSLRGQQEENVKLDQKKNILDAAGLAIGEFGKVASDLEKSQIDELSEWVSEKFVVMETGEYTEDIDAENYDMIEAMDGKETGVDIVDPQFNMGEKRRPKVMKVFFVQRPGTDQVQQVVLPIYGKGLWGTLYGYLAVKSDVQTIQGITFYQHKETPGLGGEVDNPRWKAQWEGRKLFDQDGTPAALVFKGPAPTENPYAVDGLSGATITSRGVTNLLRYWASDDGFGPFLKNWKSELAADSSAN